jgi:hypothetical protein
MKTLILIALILSSPILAQPQTKDWPIAAPKNSAITVKVPKNLIGDPKYHRWQGNVSYTVIVGRGEDGAVVVNDRRDWRDAGWPLMLELQLKNLKSSKTKTEVQLKSGTTEIYLKFNMAPELVSDVFRQVAFSGTPDEFEKSPEYQEVGERLLPAIFSSGKLAGLTREQQLKVIRVVGYDTTAAQAQEYKGKTYIAVNVTGDSVYNTLQLGQAARVARVTQDYLLKALKEKYALVSDIPGLDGIAVKMEIQYKDFLEKYVAAQHDDLILYASLKSIKDFSDAEITSQQLLDQSIVLVNGDRIQVSLDLAK